MSKTTEKSHQNAQKNGQDGFVTAGILVIGNEILSGRTKDTNSGYIAEALTAHGITVREIQVIPDIIDLIEARIRDYAARFDYVFTCGGIGPTHDDKTAEAFARAFDTELELNAEAHGILIRHYGADRMNKGREKMAWMPKGAGLIENSVSAAPGIHMKNVFGMAGVPDIMKAMLGVIIPTLRAGLLVHSRTIGCDDIPESMIAPDLERIENAYAGLDVGSYPRFKDGVAGLNIVIRSTNTDILDKAEAEIRDAAEKIRLVAQK